MHSEEFAEINKNGQFWNDTKEISYHLQKGRAVFASSRALDSVRKHNCSQMFRTFGQTGVSQNAFALRKKHPLFLNISHKILEYQSLGIITEIINRYKPSCPLVAEDNILPRSNLTNMKGLLAVTTSLALFGGFVMIADRSMKRAGKVTSMNKGKRRKPTASTLSAKSSF